jgi:Hint domain
MTAGTSHLGSKETRKAKIFIPVWESWRMTTTSGPVISGAGVAEDGSFTVPINPFSGVTISDPNAGATETATITLSDYVPPFVATDANGLLSLPGGSVDGVTLIETAPGVYTLSAGSPDAMTQALDALQFTPIANPSQPGPVTTNFALSVSDGIATATADNTVLAGAPVITGTVAGQLAAADQSINPFSTVSLTDSPGVTNLNVLIDVRDSSSSSSGPTTDADGSLSLPGSVQGVSLHEMFPGIYSLSGGSPAQVTAALDALVFKPTLTPFGQTVTTDFQLSVSDGLSTTNNYTTSVVATDAPCFCRGTMILTERGEVPVEELAIGDRLVTSSGAIAPISWIGKRKVTAQSADPLRSWPVRIKASALAEGVPSRDLLLSPDHAVFLDGILIQAGALVNDTSIVRETDVPEVFDYYHVELDDHALILANNVRSETFIDNVERVAFDNWKEHETLYPGGKPVAEMPCPRAKAHRQVPRVIREMLAERGIARYGAQLASAA